MKTISILDTTLRDGEQTAGVSFSPEEKLIITKALIEKGNVQRVEICSCKASDSDYSALSSVMEWARENNHENKIEVLSFVDINQSIDWMAETGCKNINLLAKGSRLHCERQLGKTLQQHVDDIKRTVEYAYQSDINVSVYLEDWSRGIQSEDGYVLELIENLSNMPVISVYLCDTLGVLDPVMTQRYVRQVVKNFPRMAFDFHAHNDYGLATANSLAAVREGVRGVHCTLNGLGERTGNASLFEVVVGLKDFEIAATGVNESAMADLSRICTTYSQKQIGENTPIVGKNVFTHVAGIHADGMAKGDLYEGRLKPDRFGREWSFPLSKLSGKKTLHHYLQSNDSVDLTIEEQNLLMKRISELSENKKEITPKIMKEIIKEIKS